MVLNDTLRNVKQLGLEIHTRELGDKEKGITSLKGFVQYYETLNALETFGFRRWQHHDNPLGMYTSSRTGRYLPCCFELHFVNINFI